MGMYTELHYNAELKKDADPSVIAILKYMVGDSEDYPTLPNDELFSSSRWEYMLRCDSYYFAADTHSTLRFDDISDAYYLCVRCNLKNYDSEIEKFIVWIRPYIAHINGDFLGFYRYEEFEQPTLVYA